MHGVEDVDVHVKPPSRQSSFGLEPGLAPFTHWARQGLSRQQHWPLHWNKKFPPKGSKKWNLLVKRRSQGGLGLGQWFLDVLWAMSTKERSFWAGWHGLTAIAERLWPCQFGHVDPTQLSWAGAGAARRALFLGSPHSTYISVSFFWFRIFMKSFWSPRKVKPYLSTNKRTKQHWKHPLAHIC